MENNVYVTEGCFCSPNCAASYIFSNNRTCFHDKWNQYSMLINMYKLPWRNYSPHLSPPKEALTIFGGHLTIEEYRKRFMNNEILETIVYPPVKMSHAIQNTSDNSFGLRMTEIDPYNSMSTYKTDTKPLYSNNNDNLVLKRPKNKRKCSVLDRCMKISMI